MAQNYYELLELNPELLKNLPHGDSLAAGTFENAVVRAFRKASKQNHPDAEDKFKKINEAYEVLSDPLKRRAYDASLLAQRHASPPPRPAHNQEQKPKKHKFLRFIWALIGLDADLEIIEDGIRENGLLPVLWSTIVGWPPLTDKNTGYGSGIPYTITEQVPINMRELASSGQALLSESQGTDCFSITPDATPPVASQSVQESSYGRLRKTSLLM